MTSAMASIVTAATISVTRIPDRYAVRPACRIASPACPGTWAAATTAPARLSCAVAWVGSGEPGREQVVDTAAVAGGEDAAEDRDAERSAELAGRLEEARHGTGPLGRGDAEDVVRDEGQDRDGATRHDPGSDQDDGQRAAGVDRGQDDESRCGDGEPAGHDAARPSFAEKVAATGAAAPTASEGTRPHSAARRGLMPSTDWRYCVMTIALPMTPNIPTTLTATAPPTRRSRNSAGSTIGCAVVRWRWTKTAPRTTPHTPIAVARSDQPSVAVDFTA